MSYLPYLMGAALSWNAEGFDQALLVPVLSRDVFHDPTQQAAQAALALGFCAPQVRLSLSQCHPLWHRHHRPASSVA